MNKEYDSNLLCAFKKIHTGHGGRRFCFNTSCLEAGFWFFLRGFVCHLWPSLRGSCDTSGRVLFQPADLFGLTQFCSTCKWKMSLFCLNQLQHHMHSKYTVKLTATDVVTFTDGQRLIEGRDRSFFALYGVVSVSAAVADISLKTSAALAWLQTHDMHLHVQLQSTCRKD